MEIVRLALGTLLLAASAVVAVQLWNGRWQFLIARPMQTKKGVFFPEGTRKAGQRVSWAMVAFAAAMATQVSFGMAEMSGDATLAQIAFVLNLVALAAWCAFVLWAVLAHVRSHGRPYFGDGFVRLPVTLLVGCVVLTASSYLFS